MKTSHFVQNSRADFSFLSYPCWDFQHGFLNAEHDFSREHFATSRNKFIQAFNLENLIVAKQVHGNTVLDFSNKDLIDQSIKGELLEADAIFVPATFKANYAFGIRTADCGCILAKSKKGFVLIHSGWKGLANGIIPKALDLIADQQMQVLLGPSADFCCYEVEHDILDQIGTVAQFCEYQSNTKKAKLSVNQTASSIIKSRYGIEAINCQLCTICSPNYFSYRRQGEDSGRNLSFIISNT